MDKLPVKLSHGFTLIELMFIVAIVAVLAGISYPVYQDYIKQAKISTATGEIMEIELLLQRYHSDNFSYPDTLDVLGPLPNDPWGNPYQYLNIATVKGKGKLRKDHSLVPINSDYDLYSMGEDGMSVSPLTAKHSRDDIIRANNGGYVGLASDY